LALHRDVIFLHQLSERAMRRYLVANQYFLIEEKVDLGPQEVHESLRIKHDVEHEI